jgi:hypothetical protein
VYGVGDFDLKTDPTIRFSLSILSACEGLPATPFTFYYWYIYAYPKDPEGKQHDKVILKAMF